MAKEKRETAAAKKKRLAAEEKAKKLAEQKEAEAKLAEGESQGDDDKGDEGTPSTVNNGSGESEGDDKVSEGSENASPVVEGDDGDKPAVTAEGQTDTDPEADKGEKASKDFPVKEDEPVVINAIGAAGEGRSTEFKLVVIAIDEYVQVMDRRNGQGVDQQMLKQIRLFRALQSVFLLKGDDLMDGFNYVLDAFKENRSNAFTNATAFRNIDNIALATKEIHAFTSLLHLFIKAAAVGRGNVHKFIDIPLLHDKMTNKEAATIAVEMFKKQ